MKYRDWLIEKVEGTQLGYRTATRLFGKGRKIRGYQASHPEHLPTPKWCDTLAEAKQYVDEYMGEQT